MNNTSVYINNAYIPSDIIDRIIEWTEIPSPVGSICKCFKFRFDSFFKNFFQDCDTAQLNWIKLKDCTHPVRNKVESVCKNLIIQINETKLSNKTNEWLGLKISRESIQKWRILIEGDALLKLFAAVAKQVPAACTWPASSDPFQQAEEIYNLLSSSRNNLKIVKELDLDHFSELPKEIGLFTDLQILRIRNYAASLPREIGKLETLRELYLQNNYFRSLPQEIGDLKQLKRLTLNNNRFENLPEEICYLEQLEELDLHFNQLTGLPKNIGNLYKLQRLFLSSNRLTSLPKEICDLKQLEELDLSQNKLSSLPQEIGNLTGLKKLTVKFNQLTTLPTEIGNLNKLQELALTYNQLTSLPTEMINLTALDELDVTNNKLTSTPEWLDKLIDSGIAKA